MTNSSQGQFQYIRLTPVQLDAALAAHEAYLSGRRAAPAGLLRFIWAPGTRYDARRLSDADFTGSHLTGSSFIGADLKRASLYCANLAGSDFRRARMERADLRGCKLAGANLGGAILDEADMRAAVLMAANRPGDLRLLGSAPSGHPNLDDAEAHAVDFTNCSLRGARMRNANLKNANFTGANLDGVDFSGAKLAGARFEGAILTGVDLERLGLSAAVLASCVIDPSSDAVGRLGHIRDVLECGHAWVATGGKEGRPAALDGLDLRPAHELFRNRLLVGLAASQVVAIGLDFTDSELAGANFDGADLRAANFTGCDLRGASFRGARLGHAVFRDAKIEALPLTDGTIRHTCFDGASIDGSGLILKQPPAEERLQA